MSAHMGYLKKPFVDMIPNKVKINGNVFHAGVENRIYTEMSRTNIVTQNDRPAKGHQVQWEVI